MNRSQKLLAAALAVSVALNLFAVGAVVSRHLFDPPHHKSGWAAKREAAEVLPEQERERVDAIWERDRGAVRQEFRAMRDARRRFREILTAENFDPAAAQSTLAELYERKEATRATMETKIMEIATSLPPEQRRAYFHAFFEDERRRDEEWARREREREEGGRD